MNEQINELIKEEYQKLIDEYTNDEISVSKVVYHHLLAFYLDSKLGLSYSPKTFDKIPEVEKGIIVGEAKIVIKNQFRDAFSKLDVE